MGILAAEAFAVQYMYHRTKQQSPGQIVFCRDMILTINHVLDWRYICQRKQAKIDKDAIRENTTRINYDYKVGDQVLIRNIQYDVRRSEELLFPNTT